MLIHMKTLFSTEFQSSKHFSLNWTTALANGILFFMKIYSLGIIPPPPMHGQFCLHIFYINTYWWQLCRVCIVKFNKKKYFNFQFFFQTDHDPRNPSYIVTQGPLGQTVSDFWQMVWEQGCVVIVMLSRYVNLLLFHFKHPVRWIST